MNQYKYDFSKDTRQSKVAILLLIWKYYKIVFRQFFFLIIPLFFTKNNKSYYIFIIGVILVTILVFIMAIMAYFRFYFRIENNELIIQKGVFKKSKLNIPFERIQTINFEQNILLQALQRYKVEVDTAGSAKKEFSFDALDMDVAKQLRQKILDRKKEIKLELTSDEKTDVFQEEQFVYEDLEAYEEETILSHSPMNLLKIGLTENHIKAGAWLIAIMGYLFGTLNDAGLKIEDRIEDSEFLKGFDPGMTLFLSLIPFILLVLVGISVIRVFLKYFNLKFNRIENGFKIFSGLLNRKENSAPDNKIQKVAWGDNPLKRIFGINILWLKQARSTEADRNKSISIPVVSDDHVKSTLSFLYGEEIEKEQYEFPISQHFFWRHLIYFIIIPSILIAISGIYFDKWFLYPVAGLFLLYFSITTFIQYKKSKFFFNDFLLKRKKGIYGNYNEIIPWYKVQVVELKQSIYQRRYELASVSFYTAAGELKIPYISLEQAKKLRDYALYKAESSIKEWM